MAPRETLADLRTPALLLDLEVVEANLQRMAARTRQLGVDLRPHAKTHKCIEIARRQVELGARGLTVSTLYEATTFAQHGFNDITWAFPVILNRIPQAAELAGKITLRLVVDSNEAVDALEASGHPFHVWLKIDSGYHRAGVDPRSPHVLDLARRLAGSSRLQFDGILTHSGHAYHGTSRQAIQGIAEEERCVMAEFAGRLRTAIGRDVAVSVGSTPAMSAVTSLEGVSEARPGNYVFYDYTQAVLGSCGIGDIGVSVLSTVVSSQPGANHAVIDAGALSLSKDTGPERAPHATMGEVFDDYGHHTLRSDVRVVSLSQEHGILSAALKVGTRVRIAPNHSCLTVAHFDEYAVVRGQEVVDKWRIWRGRD